MLSPEEIKTARINRGMTITELAKKIGMTTPYISDLERGHRKPSKETMIKLGEALGYIVHICPHCGGEGVIIKKKKGRRLPLRESDKKREGE